MSFGLEVYDNMGVKTIHISDRLTRYYNTYNFSVPPSSTQTINVSGCDWDGTWVAHVHNDTGMIGVSLEKVFGGVKLFNNNTVVDSTGNVVVFRI